MGNSYPVAYRRSSQVYALPAPGPATRGFQPGRKVLRSSPVVSFFDGGGPVRPGDQRHLYPVTRQVPIVRAPKGVVRKAEQALWSAGGPSWLGMPSRELRRHIPKLPKTLTRNLPSNNFRHPGALASGLPWVKAWETADFAWNTIRAFRYPVSFGMNTSNGWTRYGNCPAGLPRVKFSTPGGGSSPSAAIANQCNNCLANQYVAAAYDISAYQPASTARAVYVFSAPYGFNQHTFLEYWHRPLNTALNNAWTTNYATRLYSQLRFPAPRASLIGGNGLPPAITMPPMAPRVVFRLPGQAPSSLYGRPYRGRFVGHYRAKPKGYLEKKFFLAIHRRSAVGRMMNFHGESADFVESFYSTLPRYLKSRNADTLNKRTAIVMANLHRVDWGRALVNLIENQAEDFVYGTLGSIAAVFNKWTRTPIGVMQLNSIRKGGSPLSLDYFKSGAQRLGWI